HHLFCTSTHRRTQTHSFPTRRSSDLGDGTHVAVENCKVISGGEYDCCIQVSGGASLRVADSNISKYHTAIAVIGSPVSRTTAVIDRKSTRLNSSHVSISYAVFCLKKQ